MGSASCACVGCACVGEWESKDARRDGRCEIRHEQRCTPILSILCPMLRPSVIKPLPERFTCIRNGNSAPLRNQTFSSHLLFTVHATSPSNCGDIIVKSDRCVIAACRWRVCKAIAWEEAVSSHAPLVQIGRAVV